MVAFKRSIARAGNGFHISKQVGMPEWIGIHFWKIILFNIDNNRNMWEHFAATPVIQLSPTMRKTDDWIVIQ